MMQISENSPSLLDAAAFNCGLADIASQRQHFLGAPHVSVSTGTNGAPSVVRALDLGNGSASVFSLASEAVA